MDKTTDRLKNIDQEDFKHRKQQVFDYLHSLEYKDLPNFVFFTYEGHRFDLTEEFYRTLI
jgi:hypothetical protein